MAGDSPGSATMQARKRTTSPPSARSLAGVGLVIVSVLIGLVLAGREAPSANSGGASLKLIMPYPLSGPRDIQGPQRATRLYQALAPHAPLPVSELLGEIVIRALADRPGSRAVRERRPTASAEMLARDAASDTHPQRTLVLASHASSVFEPHPYAAGAVSFEKQFVLIEPLAIMPFVLMVVPELRAQSKDAFVARLAEQPKQRYFASSGEYSAGHLAAESLRLSLHLNAIHVPYNGGHAGLSALIAGQVDLMFVALPLALPYMGQGKVHALGIASRRRFDTLPELPTLREIDFDGPVVEGWFALFASARMPAKVRDGLGERVRSMRDADAVRGVVLQRGLMPVADDAARFAQGIAADTQRWRLVREGMR